MSINLNEKINLIYDFINNNINNCYKIENININKITIDDIRIKKGTIEDNIYNQIINEKIQFAFEINNNLYYYVYTDSFPFLVKISVNNLDKSNNDSLISYILSEIALKYKLNILLPILNLDINYKKLSVFLKIKTNNIFENNKNNNFQLII